MRFSSFGGALLCGMLLARAVLADDAGEPVQCTLNYAPAAACRMTDRVADDGVHTIVFAVGGRRLQFTGTSQTGWWSGRLDGQPAMGYELNRGHVVFSTTDLKTRLEWWSDGNEHGSY
ncbi:MAG TPA: hypothetical protein VGC30_06140 [Dokdonella sp.]